ncbi:MAG: metallophosphoesterase, partial [Rikenellaceae bacterium]
MVYKFIIILLVIDLFVGLVLFFRFHKKTITLTWSLQALLFYALVVVMWLHFISSEVENYVTMGSIMAFVAVCYFVKVLFGSLGGIILLSELALKRRAWSWITVYLLTLGGFFVSLYGVTIGRYDYKITHRNVVINDLPKSFKGFKIVQISDLHLGSFAKDYKGVDKLIEDINSENADVVLFSGDMVNSYADEMEPWIEKLRGIKSRYGNFAVTGNHDHGDHAHFSTAAARVDNLNRFFENMERASFKMLNNDSHALTIGGDTI